MRMAVTKNTMTLDEEQPEFFVLAEDFSRITASKTLRIEIALALKKNNYSIGPLRNFLNEVHVEEKELSNHVERLGFYAKNR